MSRLIDADILENRMYHEAFEKDSDMQKWDSGCWIRYKLFEKALREQPTVDPEPHWIPVTERLPKEFGSYQVTTTHGKVATYIFVTDSISSYEYWKRNVTAWMPLPKPYKEVTT